MYSATALHEECEAFRMTAHNEYERYTYTSQFVKDMFPGIALPTYLPKLFIKELFCCIIYNFRFVSWMS